MSWQLCHTQLGYPLYISFLLLESDNWMEIPHFTAIPKTIGRCINSE
jgi:hypothetical protein